MSEPLAATLLVGAVLAMLLGRRPADGRAGGPRAALALAAAGRPARSAGAGPAGVPGRRRPARRWSSSRRERTGRLAPLARRRPLILLAGVRRRRRALDDPQRDRPRPLRADLDRRRPGPLRRHLPARGRRSGKGRRRGRRPPPGAVRPRRRPSACGWSRSSPGSPRRATRTWKPTRRSRGWASEQLWDDVTEEPLEYAGFVADQGRADLVARAARRDARAGLGGAALGAGRASACSASACSPGGGAGRRWCSATIFLAITAISALLVASPRRVLVMLPLVAALAGRRVSPGLGTRSATIR